MPGCYTLGGEVPETRPRGLQVLRETQAERMTEGEIRGLVATARVFGVPAMRNGGMNEQADKIEAIIRKWDYSDAQPRPFPTIVPGESKR